MFTRKSAWKEFKYKAVVLGTLPDLSLKKFMENFPGIRKNIASDILRLILKFIDFEPSTRPLMEGIYEMLDKIEIML